MSYFDYAGKQVVEVAGVLTTVRATGSGQTVTATGPLAQVADLAGGDTLIGGSVSTDFIVVDPNTVVVQGAHTGVSTVTTWMNYTLPTGVDDLYEQQWECTAVGNSAQNLIIADGAHDTLNGGGGNDVLVDSNVGGVRFQFDPVPGHEVVYGFQTSGANHDFIDLGAYGFTNFSQVASLLSQDGADTLLTLSSADSVLIRNTQVSSLTASDFLLALDTSKMTMTFDDEFNSLSLYNSSTGLGTWKTSYAFGTQSGYGSYTSRTLTPNNEQEIYVDPSYTGSMGGTTALGLNPFSISNGVLTITAALTPAGDLGALDGYKYTSGLLTTQNSFAQTYGYFEMKAELPTQQGMWPAFWLLPETQAAGGVNELDVMEEVDGGNVAFQTAHSGTTSSSVLSQWASAISGLTSGFHTYGLLWTAQELVWYIDGKAVAEIATPASMNSPMYMLIDLAVGGNWPGSPNANFTSAQMEIDYVRAYSLNGTVVASGAGSTTTTPNAPVTTYTASSSTDVPTSTSIDTISSAYSYTLPASFVHTLTLTGSGNLTATANNLGDHITGNAGADTLIGGTGADTLDASKGGNDLLNGAAGGQDTFIAGAGADTFVVSNGADVITGVPVGSQDVVQSSVNYHLTANAAELVLIGSGLSGWSNSTGATLVALAGGDTLYGGAGNDHFTSATAGADTMVGGAGSDTFVVNDAGDVITPGTGGSTVWAAVSYHLPDNIQLGSLGGSANLSLWGGAGAVQLLANSGNDTIYAGSGADTLIGGAGADTFYGGAGADSFMAGAGLDTFIAGTGVDTFRVNNAADVITGVPVGSQDVVQSSVNYHLTANAAELVLIGSGLSGWSNSTGATLVALAGGDTLYGGAGNDHFTSATAGADTMVGGAGSDTFVVNDAGDVITPGTGGSTVWAAVSYHLPDNIQLGSLGGSANLSLWGGAGAVQLLANSGNDTIYAGSGADTLIGGAGADTFYGGAGADSFMAGAGLDTFIAGTGVDTFRVNNAADVITGVPVGSQDVVQSSVNYHLTANAAELVLIGSGLSGWSNSTGATLVALAGGDTLYGGAGNDHFTSATAGADTMVGGAGSDTFVVNNAGDVITPGTGGSTVWAAVSYHLPDNIQLGSLGGSANLSLWGGAGAVQLLANSGNDTIYAGSGADTLIGGAGADTFVFGLGSGKDIISDFLSGNHDVVDISAYLNQGYTASVAEVGANAVVSISNGETITLLGVQANSLTHTSTGYIH